MRKIALTLVLYQIVFLAACQQPQKQVSKEIVIPMDMSTQRPIVEVMIDGNGPYAFIFDTGSTTNVIDEELSKSLGLKIVGEDPLRTPGSENRLVSKRVAARKVSFPNTNISKDLEMNTIALRSMLSVDGILGGYFLEDYLVTMDYPGSRLVISLGELANNDEGVTSFIQSPRVLNLSIDVAGNSMEAHLDTGNPGAFTLPYSMKDKLTFKENPTEGPPIRTPVASFKRWDAELVGSIVVGDITYKNPRVMLAEGFEFVNLGFELFKDLKTTIDRKNNLIKFERGIVSYSKAEQVTNSEPSPFSGTYEGDRKIWINETGKLVYQRPPTPMALELVLVDENLYVMKLPKGVMAPNEIPSVFFIKNENQEVTGIELVFKDGRRDGPYKRISD